MEALVVQMYNDTTYKNLLHTLLYSPVECCEPIKYEILNSFTNFSGDEDFTCANNEYVDEELKWYIESKRNIHTNKVIEKNKIWSRIAADDGSINSNYGWCIFSKENSEQYKHALEALKSDIFTKHAVMIYSRPSINTEWNDGIHSKSDMICTIYTAVNVRKRHDKYYMTYTVHMRSCDAWLGLRNDLMWHKFILNMLKQDIEKARNIKIYKSNIVWIADSLHLYDFEVKSVKKLLGV